MQQTQTHTDAEHDAAAFWKSALDGAAEEKRQWRIEHCGAFYSSVSVETGQLKSFQMDCDAFHECPKCLTKRMKEFEKRILYALGTEGPLMYKKVRMSEERAYRTKLSRRKLKFLRFPLFGGYTAFIFQAYETNAAEPVKLGTMQTQRDLDTGLIIDTVGLLVRDEFLEWEVHILTPKGRKITGELGRIPEEKKDHSDDVLCTVSMVRISQSVPAEIRKKSWDEALALTADLLPDTLEEALTFTMLRTEAYCEQLETNLIPLIAKERRISELEAIFWTTDEYISIVEHKLYVNPNEIDWSGSVSHVPNEFLEIKDLETHPPPV